MTKIYKIYYKGEFIKFFMHRWKAEKYIEERNNDYILVEDYVE